MTFESELSSEDMFPRNFSPDLYFFFSSLQSDSEFSNTPFTQMSPYKLRSDVDIGSPPPTSPFLYAHIWSDNTNDSENCSTLSTMVEIPVSLLSNCTESSDRKEKEESEDVEQQQCKNIELKFQPINENDKTKQSILPVHLPDQQQLKKNRNVYQSEQQTGIKQFVIPKRFFSKETWQPWKPNKVGSLQLNSKPAISRIDKLHQRKFPNQTKPQQTDQQIRKNLIGISERDLKSQFPNLNSPTKAFEKGTKAKRILPTFPLSIRKPLTMGLKTKNLFTQKAHIQEQAKQQIETIVQLDQEQEQKQRTSDQNQPQELGLKKQLQSQIEIETEIETETETDRETKEKKEIPKKGQQ
eukprot:Anaeramoba_flamelloidesc40484_g1_i1.p1 GENE.c40484_g1_i1~~c40484_g1_i1.p1  ORF type:complete len:354 (-),score=81.65 c40484_g1_i1:139-1200(-)